MKSVENETTMSSNSEYGIGVTTNKFVLFGMEEEEDPLELLKRHELEREEKRKNKIALKNSVKAAPVAAVAGTGKAKQQKNVQKDQQTAVKKPENQKPKDDRRIMPKKETFTERRENKPLFRDNEQSSNGYNNSNENGFSNGQVGRPPRDDNNGFQRGGRRGGGVGTKNVYFRGGAGGRGGRGGFNRPPNFDNRGKREYDRHSGSDKTGVKPINKRDGAGQHNWGNIQDECSVKHKTNQDEEAWLIEGESKTVDESFNNVPLPEESSKTSLENSTIADSNKEVTKDSKEEQPEIDEEKKELTLDEWRALKGPRSQPQFNVRKAGEGEVLPGEWKGMKALEKKKEGVNEEEDDEECEYELCVYPQRVGRQKRVQGIDIKFKDNRGYINGDRGGRGGRGFGGRRGPNARDFGSNTQQDRNQPPAPKVDDLEDFPSLA